jgi:hypothetical protein
MARSFVLSELRRILHIGLCRVEMQTRRSKLRDQLGLGRQGVAARKGRGSGGWNCANGLGEGRPFLERWVGRLGGRAGKGPELRFGEALDDIQF